MSTLESDSIIVPVDFRDADLDVFSDLDPEIIAIRRAFDMNDPFKSAQSMMNGAVARLVREAMNTIFGEESPAELSEHQQGIAERILTGEQRWEYRAKNNRPSKLPPHIGFAVNLETNIPVHDGENFREEVKAHASFEVMNRISELLGRGPLVRIMIMVPSDDGVASGWDGPLWDDHFASDGEANTYAFDADPFSDQAVEGDTIDWSPYLVEDDSDLPN